jgi:hypothetical protein
MKTLLISAFLLASLGLCRAGTTINAPHNEAYGANIGWVNWRGDVANGAVIGEYVCSGYLYAANVGWINLGSGLPANGIQYQNNAATDFGVNLDALGNLRGLAWGANIGWINFENTGAPKVDLVTGNLSGYVWSANCGWISLSNAVAYVQTDTIAPGVDTDANGLPDAWELINFGDIGMDPNDDMDGDGASNLAEYQAGTDPLDPSSVLRITHYDYEFGPISTTVTLTWNSVPARRYYIDETSNLVDPEPWLDCGLELISPDPGSSTMRSYPEASFSLRFYRVKAVRPLGP